jgi:hypothetical protein
MKKLQILLSSFLLILAFVAEAKLPPPGTGKADVPANIYIMLDTSGSMGARVSSQGKMLYPNDVTVDSGGNIFVVEYHYHRVKKYSASGAFIRSFGSMGSSDGKFYYPERIDIDANDNVYITDRYKIQKFNSSGVWLKSFGGLRYAKGVTVDPSGNVYANSTSKIRKWNSSGNFVADVAVSNSYGLDWYGGSIYSLDRSSRKIKKHSDSLVLQNTWSLQANTQAGDILATSQGIYVTCENSCAKIQKYSLSGTYVKQWGRYSSGSGPNDFYYLKGIGSDSSNNIYATNFYRHRIQKYDSNGGYLGSAGPADETRMSEVLKVIDKLTSSADLTKGANFGLQDWASSANQRVPITVNGAGLINKSVTPKITVNGVLQNNPDYKGSTWYRPSGGTNLDAAMIEAQRYFMGTHGKKSPIDSNASCQKNFLIVISDGQWYGSRAENIAKSLLKLKGIETLVIGFHSGGNQTNYIRLAKAGGTYPESPLFSNNWQQLYETMSAYIRQAISSRLTFSAPVVMPNYSTDDHIYQSTFEYKNDHQWKGRLSKFTLLTDGQIGALKWDAGEKLDLKKESSRKIWTMAKTFNINTTINNFTTSNKTELGQALSENSGTNPIEAETIKLINFVRGLDSYDENANQNTTEKRWKLGDIYNSRLIVVGKPDARISDKKSKAVNKNTEAYYRDQNGYKYFKDGSSCGAGVGSCRTRKEVVYVGANDGMLHAFDSITGDELWAFIPPQLLQYLDEMVAVKANKSTSIYGVDGSPIVKDIYYGGQWRTVLIAGLGKGGFGYFALDITAPLEPQFLFAFENKYDLSMIYHWDSTGARTDIGYAGLTAEYDYSKIGEATSNPVIVAMPYGNTTKWVAVFGGGYNAGINSNYGSSIYVIDLENQGKILKKIDLADVSATNNISNAMPADLVSITPDTTSKANYKGSMIYGADLEGKQWKLNLTDKGTLYDITAGFNAEATLDNDRTEFFQITPSIGNDDHLWNFFGTGNQQRLQTISANINNRVFGLKDTKFPLYEDVSTPIPTATSLKNMPETGGGSCPTSADMGWYVNLGSNQRVTGKLAVFNEKVYATRYKPNRGAICTPGVASLSEHALICGNKTRTITLGDGIATGVVIYNNRVYVGISGSGSGDIKDDKGNVVGKKKNNLIVITPQQSGTIGNGAIVQESWREIF